MIGLIRVAAMVVSKASRRFMVAVWRRRQCRGLGENCSAAHEFAMIPGMTIRFARCCARLSRVRHALHARPARSGQRKPVSGVSRRRHRRRHVQDPLDAGRRGAGGRLAAARQCVRLLLLQPRHAERRPLHQLRLRGRISRAGARRARRARRRRAISQRADSAVARVGGDRRRDGSSRGGKRCGSSAGSCIRNRCSSSHRDACDRRARTQELRSATSAP